MRLNRRLIKLRHFTTQQIPQLRRYDALVLPLGLCFRLRVLMGTSIAAASTTSAFPRLLTRRGVSSLLASRRTTRMPLRRTNSRDGADKAAWLSMLCVWHTLVCLVLPIAIVVVFCRGVHGSWGMRQFRLWLSGAQRGGCGGRGEVGFAVNGFDGTLEAEEETFGAGECGG